MINSLTHQKGVISVVNVKKKPGESNENLIRRFSRKVHRSGTMQDVRRRKFFQGKMTKRKTREKAMRRIRIEEEREYMRRIGKLDEFEAKYGRIRNRKLSAR